MKPIEMLEEEYGVDLLGIELYDGAILKLANKIDGEIESVILSKDHIGDYFYLIL